ncbi:MAG: hypothetical protein K6G48_07495 [Acholeplasmatales bacterium]|nr:hypothetical protein [Acholeplasmatales bacterium]
MILDLTGISVIISSIVLGVVIFAGIINAKIYNIIHGFISIFGIASILGLIDFVIRKSGHSAAAYSNAVEYTITAFLKPLLYLFQELNLTFMANEEKAGFYLVPIAIFIISFILASMLKRLRRNKD